MSTAALIFDFDGLIIDTERPDFLAWQEIYEEYGATLALQQWQRVIGTTLGARDSFDPYVDLGSQLGRTLERELIDERRRKRFVELVEKESLLPGVEQYLDEAQRLGLRLGIASTSRREWVLKHLERLGLTERFDCVRCGDDVGVPKPAPDLYLSVLDAFSLPASGAVALEDSPNGIRSAKGAGIFCVAVPNGLTRDLDLRESDIILESLEAMSLQDLLVLVAERR